MPNEKDESGAIWKVEVCGSKGGTSTYRHVLTCLVFETQRLFLPTRKVPIFEGSIEVTEAETAPVSEAERTSGSGVEIETTGKASASELKQPSESVGSDEDAPGLDPFAEGPAPTDMGSNETGATTRLGEDGAETQSNEDATNAGERAASGSEAATTRGSGESPDGEPALLFWENSEHGAIAGAFIAWVREGLLEKTLPFNKPSAVLHVVDDGVLIVSPAGFKQFCERFDLVESLLDECDGDREKAVSKAMNRLQRQVARLKLNLKSPGTGQNVHAYWVAGQSRKSRINCWLFPHKVFFSDPSKIPQSNQYIHRDTPECD